MGRKRGDKRNEKNRIIEVKERILKENKTKEWIWQKSRDEKGKGRITKSKEKNKRKLEKRIMIEKKRKGDKRRRNEKNRKIDKKWIRKRKETGRKEKENIRLTKKY